MDPLPDGAQRVQEFLDFAHANSNVRVLPDSTATAQEAANALGVPVSHIGKSIVFGSEADTIVAVICGDQRVSASALSEATGCPGLKSLKADDVRKRTGFVIGGVSPFALPAGVRIVVDGRLASLRECYVAAGHPKAVVHVLPQTLVALTSAQVASVTDL